MKRIASEIAKRRIHSGRSRGRFPSVLTPMAFRSFAILILAFSAIGLVGCLETGAGFTTFIRGGDPAARARRMVSEMSPEELVGQSLMMTWPGETPPPLLLDWIRLRRIGGIKAFGWNGKNPVVLAGVIATLQKAALESGRGIPLLVATDQEGGMVRHIKGSTSQTPGNMALGATADSEDARLTGLYIGRELAAMGINMNFAPVVDLATEPRSHIIGPRAFSDDPLLVSRLGAAFAAGLSEAGIIATAKHFPGHGDTLIDSHGKLPVISIDERTLRSRELLPFAALIREGIPAVMAGHLSFPAIEPGGLPASLSKRFMTGILRTELGFRGIAITDDLSMSGAAASFGQGGTSSKLSPSARTAKLALEAGNDVIMFSRLLDWNDGIWRGLVDACVGDPAFRSRMEEAASRILEVKLRNLDGRLPAPSRVPSLVPDREGRVFFREQAVRAATLLSGGDSLPVPRSGKIVLAAPFDDFIDLAGPYYPGASGFRFSYRPMDSALPGEIEAFRKAIQGADSIILCVANGAGSDFARVALATGARVAVVAVDSPIWAMSLAPRAAVVAVYSDTVPSLMAGLDVISGAKKARGVLPFPSGDAGKASP